MWFFFLIKYLLILNIGYIFDFLGFFLNKLNFFICIDLLVFFGFFFMVVGLYMVLVCCFGYGRFILILFYFCCIFCFVILLY